MGTFQRRAVCALLLGLLLTHSAFAAKEDDNDDGGPDATRRPICKTVFAQMSEAYQEALLYIAEDRVEEARAKIADNEFTEEQKLFLWRLIAGRDVKSAMRTLADFKFSQVSLEEIAVDFAAKDPQVCLTLLPEMRPGSHELFTVLKTLARKIEIATVYERFVGLDQAQRTELAILQVNNGFSEIFINNQARYAIDRPEHIANLVYHIAENTKFYPEHVVGYAEALPHFTLEQRQNIALALARSAGLLRDWGTFSNLSQLRVAEFPLEVRTEIAGIAYAKHVNKHGWSPPHFEGMMNFRELGLDQTNVTDILVATLKNVKKDKLRMRQERDQFLFTAYRGRIMSLGTAVGRLKKEIFARDGLATIADHHNLTTLEDLHLVDEAASIDLTRALVKFAEENPDLLPKDFVTILWDPVRNQSVVLRMLKEFLSQTEGKWDHLPENSLQLITELTGLNYKDVAASRLQRNPGELYELVMDIQDGLAKPAFKDLPIEAAVFDNRPELLRLLRSLRDLHQQNGDGTKGWRATWKTVGLSAETGITAANLPGLYARAQEALVAAIKQKLAGQNINFTYDQFRQLEQQWGDLEPIWTLLSRYQSNENWKQEIHPLAQVFESSLQGTFRQKKFEGGFATRNDAALARAQLWDFTTPEQREAWMKARWKISVPDAREAVAQAAAEAQTLTTVRGGLTANVDTPLRAALGNPAPEITPALERDFSRGKIYPLITEKILNEDPIPLVDALIGELRDAVDTLEAPQAARELVRLGMKIAVDETSTPQEVRGSLRLVRTLLNSHKEMQLGDVTDTVKAALGSADRTLKEMGSQATGEFLLSVLNADPKFLLMIGNVVPTASCQSYTAGGHIETLLGYVMDANVQAVVTFALKQQQFKSASDFNRVVKAQAEGELIDVKFDGNLRKATFVIQRPGADAPLEIESEPFGPAYQRQMVKLGVCRRCGMPGVRLERLYHQQHPHADEMQRMHQAIVSDMIAEMGVSPERNTHAITIPPSRNPGGVYSDLGGGIKVNVEYDIP